MPTVCVFCGSGSGKGDAYRAAARRFAVRLAARGLGLVYGAGHVGLMGVLADAALAAGAPVAGVIPRFLVDRELAHRGLTELLVVDTMHQRKALMADRADAFVALPGGYGTAEELLEVLTWSQLRLHAKPVGLLNVAGYFDPLLGWFRRMLGDGFLRPGDAGLPLVADDADTLLDLLAAWRPPPPAPPRGDVR